MTWLVLTVCFLLVLFFKDQRDRIAAKKRTWFNTDFWLKNNWQDKSTTQLGKIVFWIRKNFLTFTLDGWHLCEFVIMFTVWFSVSFAVTGSILYGFCGAVNLTLLFGGLFYLLHNVK